MQRSMLGAVAVLLFLAACDSAVAPTAPQASVTYVCGTIENDTNCDGFVSYCEIAPSDDGCTSPFVPAEGDYGSGGSSGGNPEECYQVEETDPPCEPPPAWAEYGDEWCFHKMTAAGLTATVAEQKVAEFKANPNPTTRISAGGAVAGALIVLDYAVEACTGKSMSARLWDWLKASLVKYAKTITEVCGPPNDSDESRQCWSPPAGRTRTIRVTGVTG